MGSFSRSLGCKNWKLQAYTNPSTQKSRRSCPCRLLPASSTPTQTSVQPERRRFWQFRKREILRVFQYEHLCNTITSQDKLVTARRSLDLIPICCTRNSPKQSCDMVCPCSCPRKKQRWETKHVNTAPISTLLAPVSPLTFEDFPTTPVLIKRHYRAWHGFYISLRHSWTPIWQTFIDIIPKLGLSVSNSLIVSMSCTHETNQ